MSGQQNQPAQSSPSSATIPLPPAAHIYGTGALLLAGFGVPALWLISGADRLDTSDRWIIRGVATVTALVAAPVATAYLTRSVNR